MLADPKESNMDTIETAFQKCSHMGDVPTYCMFKEPRFAFPTARFILTISDQDDWLQATRTPICERADCLLDDFGAYHACFYKRIHAFRM
mmetsp:Transcript_42444/g.81118  ORF Transcript_42444/g.81118 Transcript_42444/m.81118 type:complete len:90 (+) Transcript_42444:69-338(+)